MALLTKSAWASWGNVGCGFVGTGATATAYLDGVTWGRDTGNCTRSYLRVDMNASSTGSNVVWSSGGSFTGNYCEAWDNINSWNSGDHAIAKGGTYCNSTNGCCYCICGSFAYWKGNVWGYLYGDANTDTIGFSAHMVADYSGAGYYTLPNNLRVLPPTGLSASFPTAITGSASASISSWSSNVNIGGTPTSYPGASYWNWGIDLLDENGRYLAHKCFNTGETKSCSFGSLNSGWYTAAALSGSSAANTTPYTIQSGKKYKVRVYAQNNMNQRLTVDSGWFISSPPKPTISITSTVYDPTTKKTNLCFDWSLAKSGLTPETVTWNAKLPDGTSVSSGTLATIPDGSAKSGSKCIQVPTGDQITVTVTNTAGPTGNTMSESASASAYSPVANAAFLGFDWDELRRTCVIRAEAPGAANCRIQAGYSANNYNIGDKLTTGQVGTLTVKDLNHGSGQIMYLQAVPEASNGHQFTNEIAKISVPIPNPILGVRVPSCGSGLDKEYVVDIVEQKKNCSVTKQWQNGDRVVKKSKCPPPLSSYPILTMVECVEESNIPKSGKYPPGLKSYCILKFHFKDGLDLSLNDFYLSPFPKWYVMPTVTRLGSDTLRIDLYQDETKYPYPEYWGPDLNFNAHFLPAPSSPPTATSPTSSSTLMRISLSGSWSPVGNSIKLGHWATRESPNGVWAYSGELLFPS